ncbi:MAG: CBS domain-containing protein [Armatimonadetes bacterium]|nr:CBS domain-containing protein [Armatimonadota bacterium]
MVIRDLMNRNVICVDQNASILEAAKLMLRENIGSVCVVGGSLVGMLTDRDITIKATSEGWNPAEHRVQEIMTRNPVFISPNADVLEATELMAKHHVRRLPVCQDDQIMGVVSLADVADYTRRCLDNIFTEETKAEK